MQEIRGIEYFPHFISHDDSLEFFNRLQSQLQWQEETIKIYGKLVKVPRLVCWYGDNGVQYRYSGVIHTGLPWTSELLEIKNQIEFKTQTQFNSVLGNYYRDQNDSMGWHADNEKELGEQPCIASISFGEDRLFKIRHNQTRKIFDLTLNSGSLLLMSGNFQNEWQHSVPKSRTEKLARINLTYRYIFQ